MVGALYEISVANNENLIIPLALTDQDGNARNLTGYTVSMQARTDAASTDVILDFSTYMTVTPATGIISINVPADIVASTFTAGVYHYDLIITETATGNITRILYGTIKIFRGVTR